LPTLINSRKKTHRRSRARTNHKN